MSCGCDHHGEPIPVQVVDDRWSGPLDLSENSHFLLELLDATHRWRERLVEELTFESGTHVRVSSAYQIEFPQAVLRGHVPDPERTREVHALVPLATRPKRPLVNFGVSATGDRPVHLVSRSATASLQRDYLKWMVSESAAKKALKGNDIATLFKAVCEFTPDVWRWFLDTQPSPPLALQAYLREGLRDRMTSQPTGEQVRAWADQALAIGQRIWEAAGEHEPDIQSSAHNMLLALPLMDTLPDEPEGVDALLARLRTGVERLDTKREPDRLLLAQLAEYGARYELIVETTVPLREPMTIKLVEDRPLRPEHRLWLPWFGTTHQPFPINDARSVHLEARCPDPNVRFVERRFRVRDNERQKVGLGKLQSARITRESLSVYTAHPSRPASAEVRLKLRLRPHVYAIAVTLSALNVAATVMATGVSGGGPTLDRLAILAVPTTIAAAFALTREQTALASRLISWWRWVLILTTLALWTVVICEIATYHSPPAKHAAIQVPSPSGRSLH
jgi:hypothetical protein